VQRAQIERDRAAVENAKAAEEAAKAETLRAEVALENARQELERKRPLVEHKVVSGGDWDRVQNAYKSAQAEVAASRAQESSKGAAIRTAEAAFGMSEAQFTNTLAQVKQKQAALRQAQIDVDRTYIRAPVTGTVVNRVVSGGQTVAASLQTPVLFTIAQDLKQMQVEASIVEADVSRFKVGQPVTFTVDAYPDRQFTGTVKQIRKAPKTIQNIVTYVVVINAENPDELLLPGMTANLEVVVAKRENVLKVANAALRFRPPSGQSEDGAKAEAATNRGEPGVPGRVFVLDDAGHPKPMPLRLGITDGRATEVIAGTLREGQVIVTGAASPQSATDTAPSLLNFRLR
jgi:HlyD family secretion protein